MITGQYKIYGGVIRWVAGTEKAGQIVRHLIPVGGANLLNPIPGLNFIPGIIANLQLNELRGIALDNKSQLISLMSAKDIFHETFKQALQNWTLEKEE